MKIIIINVNRPSVNYYFKNNKRISFAEILVVVYLCGNLAVNSNTVYLRLYETAPPLIASRLQDLQTYLTVALTPSQNY
jgi:hypothetical protein